MSKPVPEGWSIRTVEEIAIVFAGGTPSRNKPEYYNGSIPWVKSGEVNSRRIERTEETISELAVDESSARWAEAGSVLVAMYGATAGKVAKLMIDATLNQAVSAINCKAESATNDYIFHAIENNTRELLNSVQGSGQPNLSGQLIKCLNLMLPPLPEQQKIAAILSSVDEVIEKTQAQINKLKDLKTGMMQELLTKGVCDENGKPHTKFKDSPVGRIPVGWDVESLKALCNRITDGTHQAVQTSDDGCIPFLYVSCVRNGEIYWNKAAKLTEDVYQIASQGRVAKPDDILYTAVGSYGHAAVVNTNRRFSFQRHIAIIQPDRNQVNSAYLVEVLNSTIGCSQADHFAIGNAQLSVTLGDLGKYKIPLPTPDEQIRIVKMVESIVANIKRYQAKLEANKNLKKALMQDLLTGKVRVEVG